MQIREYIQEQVFARRAATAGCLVIYDPTRRYRELVHGLASARCRAIDAGTSVIEQREASTQALRDLAEGTIEQFVIWVPASRPMSEEERQRDPFGVFGLIGDEFPAGDGDTYASLCRKAKPDHLSEINKLFAEGEPSFDTVDALDHGGSWPKLKTLLAVSSPREILLGILSPKSTQEEALNADPTWVSEAREFIQRSLGHKLKTRGQTRTPIAAELWRLVLFSEFAFDSQGDIPPSLATVPRAAAEAKELVFDVCDELRKHADHKDRYMVAAEETEGELSLPERTKDMTNLGRRDTFAFEERHFLELFVVEETAGRYERARGILDGRRGSIWRSHEDRLAEWSLAERAADLLEVAAGLTEPKFSSLEEIIRGYAATWRELDRNHRELGQAVNESQPDHAGLDELVQQARAAYFKSIGALQEEFIRLVVQEGWPASGPQLFSNGQVFSREVAPALDAGERVAYFLVDSLRYELGVELEKRLSDKHAVRLHAICAQLPTYTEVGMASLMPDAESALRLAQKDDKLVTTLAGAFCTNPTSRFAYLQSRKGDMCADIGLEDLLRQKKIKLAEKTRLLVVRTKDIDTMAHGSSHYVLELIPSLIRQIMRGIAKVETLGFQKAVIATDHGFILFREQAAGSVAPKPPGNWLIQKSRCLLGTGEAISGSLVLKREHVGIQGDFIHYAVPKALVPYSRGETYCHEGLSLQECVLPCLTVQLKAEAAVPALPKLQISYRQGKTDKITSRRPVVDLFWSEFSNLYREEYEIEVLIDAVDAKGEVVGWVSSGQSVNPATQGVRIRPGEALAVALRMADNFSGQFTLRALDPNNARLAPDLTLRTAYFE